MNKERLEEIERNSKDAYNYMKSIEKEYLKGKTILDQRNFVHRFKENHSINEIIYLCNEMKFHKESNISFTNGFFGIAVPIYVAVFAFIGIFIGFILNFSGNLSEKMIDIKLENNDTNFDDATGLITLVGSETLKFGFIIILVFAILLIMYWIRHRSGTKRMQYLAWLNSIKELKNKEFE